MGKTVDLPKTTLSLSDRINLVNVLPQEGTWDKLTISEDVEDKIKITQKEIEEYEIKVHPTHVAWGEKGGNAKWDYNFNTLEIELIEESLKNLESSGKLNKQIKNLYKMFVKDKK